MKQNMERRKHHRAGLKNAVECAEVMKVEWPRTRNLSPVFCKHAQHAPPRESILSKRSSGVSGKKVDRGMRQSAGLLWTCRVHRRQLHRVYPIVLLNPKAILCGPSSTYFLGYWVTCSTWQKTLKVRAPLASVKTIFTAHLGSIFGQNREGY